MGSYSLIAGVLKYFLILGGFVHFDSDPLGFCPVVLLSIFAFLCAATWWHDENVDCPDLYHVIMGSYTLIIGVLKYFLIFDVLSALILILWGFRLVVLLSICALLCAATWWHDENVDCPHLFHVIMGSYTLIVGVLKYFLIFGGFVRLDSDPLGLLSCGAFVHFCFSLCGHVMAWRECWLFRPVSCDHGIIHLDCWSLKIFSHFWGFCPPWFWSFWGFCPVVLLSIFAFLCAATWWHDENVDCPDLYHVIMGSYSLIAGVLKYFLIFGGFVRLDSDLLGLSFCGAFVHFFFSLCGHVMTWREWWFSRHISCDHGIVHLDCLEF